jgi:hypothetical protein
MTNKFLFCFAGRRMGGNNMSTLERICAQCQGIMARFEIVRIKDFNFYKKTASTCTHTHIFYSFNTIIHTAVKHFEVCIVVELHAAVAAHTSTTMHTSNTHFITRIEKCI